MPPTKRKPVSRKKRLPAAAESAEMVVNAIDPRTGRMRRRRGAFKVTRRTTKRTQSRGNGGPSEVFAALGHPQRLALLDAMLKGPASYAELREATGLLPGPLYHHINELRLAGLIGPKTRDAYSLTFTGRASAMMAVAWSRAIKPR